MMYADSITKKFLTYGTNASEAGPNDSLITDHQDPTYMGFQVRIVPTVNTPSDLDGFPHGLFTANPESDPYSMYNYLLSRGEYKRAAYILEFERGFTELVNKCPWFFIKVSGLADAWKIGPAINWRGKEKKIVIETLESIDMKMTYLMDLYRKATFDAAWMRWAVPDHSRYFKMEIIVSEVRPMKISTVAANGSIFSGLLLVDGSNYQDTVDKMKQAQENQQGLYDTAAPWSTASFIKFHFEQCEFDFMSEAPTFLDSVGVSPEGPAANKITIKTNIIRERNVYGLLGAIIDDTHYVWQFGKGAADNSFGYPSPLSTSNDPLPQSQTLQAGTFTNYAQGMTDRDKYQKEFNGGQVSAQTGKVDNVNKVKDNWDQEHSVNPANLKPEGALAQTAENLANVFGPNSSPANAAAAAKEKTAAGKLLNNIGQSILAGAKDFGKSLIMSQVNSILLGNVYGLSPLSLVGSAQSIINNPAAAVQALLAKHSTPSIGSNLAKKVELTASEMQLVKGIIGVANEINSDSNAKMAQSNPGKADQKAPRVRKASKQNANLTAFANSGKTPGKTKLTGPEVPVAKSEKEKLEGPVIEHPKLGNANLQGAEVPKARLGKTDFK